tara:strand:- start:1496 stop:1777 length:282 start_codon:yes stop_codon:yes gene_type:complete
LRVVAVSLSPTERVTNGGVVAPQESPYLSKRFPVPSSQPRERESSWYNCPASAIAADFGGASLEVVGNRVEHFCHWRDRQIIAHRQAAIARRV